MNRGWLILFFLLFSLSLFGRERPYYLSIAMMFQDEGPYLKEWIEYHRLVGVEHFYLCDNASTDQYSEVLKPYIDDGIVELIVNPAITHNQAGHNSIQCSTYFQIIKKAKKETKWLAVLDADEFLVPQEGDSIPPILKQFQRDKIGGIFICSLTFGTANVDKIPEGRLMIDVLDRTSGEISELGKSIIRPTCVKKCLDPHVLFYKKPYYHVNTKSESFKWHAPLSDKKIVIFHYYTRDLDHLVNVKFPRRKRWVGIELNSYLKEIESLNNVQNRTMDRFIPRLVLNVL